MLFVCTCAYGTPPMLTCVTDCTFTGVVGQCGCIVPPVFTIHAVSTGGPPAGTLTSDAACGDSGEANPVHPTTNNVKPSAHTHGVRITFPSPQYYSEL